MNEDDYVDIQLSITEILEFIRFYEGSGMGASRKSLKKVEDEEINWIRDDIKSKKSGRKILAIHCKGYGKNICGMLVKSGDKATNVEAEFGHPYKLLHERTFRRYYPTGKYHMGHPGRRKKKK